MAAPRKKLDRIVIKSSPTARALDWTTRFYEDVLGEATVLVDRAGGQVVLLNRTGAIVWARLRDGRKRAVIAHELREHFGISMEMARRDVAALTDQLETLGGIQSAATLEAGKTIKPPASRRGTTIALALGGRRIEVVSSAPSLSVAVEALFGPLADADPSRPADATLEVRESRGTYFGAVNGNWQWRETDADMALGRLISDLTDAAYPDAKWSAVMHAGAVARGGKAIVLPGASGRGKSTLVAGLIHAGWSLLSDDIVPFDRRTRKALPVPMAVAVKERGRHVLLSRFPALATAPLHDFLNGPRRFMGLKPTAKEGCPIAAFVMPAYVPGAAPRYERVSPEQALTALTAAKCWVSPNPEEGRAFFECLRTAPSFAATYPTLEAGVQIVGELVDAL